jgi:hypothetical protein
MSVLQALISYRLQLEKEGSSKAHLSNYDRLINQECMTLKNESTNNINLINFRVQRCNEGASKEDLSIIDSRIFKYLGNQQARFVDIIIRKISGDNFNISVDLSSETIGDLYNKVANYLSDSAERIKLIYKGKYLEFMQQTLSSLHIEKNSIIGLTFRLGCDGRGCCDVNYHIISDSLLKQSESVFNKFTEGEKKNIIGGFSKLFAIEELTRQVEEKTRELRDLKEKIQIENSKKEVSFNILNCSFIEPEPDASFIEACMNSGPILVEEEDLYG